MKMASIYISKDEIAKKLGIKADQFVFGKVESDYYTIQFDVIINSYAETKSATNMSDEGIYNIRRQRLEDIEE